MGFEGMIDHKGSIHNLSRCESEDWKKSFVNRIQTCDLCDTGAVVSGDGALS